MYLTKVRQASKLLLEIKMNKNQCLSAGFTACLIVLSFFSAGFKLEKGAIEMTQTESKKAPEPDEVTKVKEVPATPNFKMDTFDNFMTEGPLQKATKTTQPVDPNKKTSRTE